MLSYFSLIVGETLVAAQAEPVFAGDQSILGVFLRFQEMGSQPADLLLEVDEVLFGVLSVCLFAQEQVVLINLVPDICDFLPHSVRSLLLLLQIAHQPNQVGPLVMELVVEVFLQVFEGSGVQPAPLFPLLIFAIYSFSFGCLFVSLGSSDSLFVIVGIQGLVELNILPQILKILLELFNSGDCDVMLAVSLGSVLFDCLPSSSEFFSEARDVQVLVDEHVVDLLDFFLELVD